MYPCPVTDRKRIIQSGLEEDEERPKGTFVLKSSIASYRISYYDFNLPPATLYGEK
jgi:hypothetical protein